MFWTRLFSGIVLLVIAIGSIWLGGPVLTLVLFAVSMTGYRELTKALGVSGGEKKFTSIEAVGMIGTAVYYLLLQSGDAVWLLGCIVFLFLAQLFVYVFTFPQYQAEQVMAGFFSFVYAPVMLSFIELTRESAFGLSVVWLILLSSWGCDTCAYVVGKLIGKKKIFPVLSPKKSLEGCIGGVLGAAALGALYGRFAAGHVSGSADPIVWQAALICAVGAVMSMVGDLAASAVKRNKGIKDYGKLIPGHGGIMDRFDSVIVTAPMVYFLAMYLIR